MDLLCCRTGKTIIDVKDAVDQEEATQEVEEADPEEDLAGDSHAEEDSDGRSSSNNNNNSNSKRAVAGELSDILVLCKYSSW